MPKFSALRIFLIMRAGSALFFSMAFTVSMYYQVTVVGLDPLQLVLVGTTLEVSVFVFEIPTGIVADLYSRRLSIIIGLALIGLGFFVMGFIPTFAAVLLGQVLWGLGYTFTSGATEAWIVDEVGEAKLGDLFLRASQVDRAGSILGTVVSVALASLIVSLPITLSGGLFGVLALFLVLFMPETGFHPAPGEQRSNWRSMARTMRAGAAAIRRSQVLMIIAGVGLFYGLYSEGYDRLWTPHLLDNIGLPTIGNLDPVVWFGIFKIIGMLLGIAAAEAIRRKVDTEHVPSIIRSLKLVTLGMIVTLAVFALAVDFPLALVMMLAFGTFRGIVDPLFSAWVNRFIPSQVRATVLSTYGQIDALGQISGGPVIGLVGEQWGFARRSC